MIYVGCPNCSANFIVNPEQIGKDGRKVRCSRCTHIWYQRLNEQQISEISKINYVLVEDNKDEKLPPLGKGINLPAPLPMKLTPYLYMIPLVLAVLFSISYFAINNNFNIETILNDSKEKISIQEIEVVRAEKLEKLEIKYKMHNSSNNGIEAPLIQIRLLDKNNNTVKSITKEYKNLILLPNNSIDLIEEIADVPDSVENVSLLVGNRIDFILH